MKSICVFCGSSTGANPIYLAMAQQLGEAIAQADLGLVYGGASVGLMGAVADAALSAGGSVTGVIPHSLRGKELDHKGLTEMHVVNSMHERKALMAELSDGFVALPGGAGTLEEFFEVWTWGQLGYHTKPFGLLNVAGYYDHLVQFMRTTVAERFIKQDHVDMVMVERDPAALLQRFAAYVPVAQPKWLK
ncbi:MAG: TIGR00730 family Rossman fold protein [Anaerolineae bacterium]|nr:TIGR00730 family Rossman fold protein [Anaerolineae bacterium]